MNQKELAATFRKLGARGPELQTPDNQVKQPSVPYRAVQLRAG